MDKFVINPKEYKISSISRTVRMKTEHFDKINEISEKTGVSFNKIVNQCIDFALSNMEDKI